MTTVESVSDRRPTYEDLKRRAEEGGYFGGRGKMDTREWYELCYFEPLEMFLYEALRIRYQEMSPSDIVVCVSTWIYDNSVSRATYEAICDRLLSGRGSVPEYILRNSDDLFQTENAKKEAVDEAYKLGYVTSYSFDMHGKIAGPFLGLRKDIDNYLNELVFRECEESDTSMIDQHGKEAFDGLTTILKKSQERDDRCYA